VKDAKPVTNEEIDIRLKDMSEVMRNNSVPGLERELELMNMSLLTIWSMLGEIVKRLPEPAPTKEKA